MEGHGGKRENAGRKTKVDEQKLIEKLSPLEKEAYSALEKNIKKGESWAVKMWFEYMYGKPKQIIDAIVENIDSESKVKLEFDGKSIQLK